MRKDNNPCWRPVTPARYAWEAAGLEYIGSRLPDQEPFRLWTNFTFPSRRGPDSEVDALVLGPSGLYLIELKYWTGRITGDNNIWMVYHSGRSAPERRASPVSEIGLKAKELAGLLREERQRSGNADRAGTAIPFVRGVVFLHHPRVVYQVPRDDRRLVVFGPDERENGTGLPGIMKLLNQGGRVTREQAEKLVPLIEKVISARRGQIVGGYLLGEEVIGQGPGFKDYIGVHTSLQNDRRIIRVYDTATVADKREQRRLDRAAHREVQLGLCHPGIWTAVSLIPGEVGPVLLYPPGGLHRRRLDQVIAEPSPMPLQARLQIIRGIADTLRYAHDRGVTHRGLSPRTVLVPLVGSVGPAAVVTDWQTADVAGDGDGPSVLRGTRNVEALLADDARWYRAPELDTVTQPDYVRADVFSLGAIAYALLSGGFPADGPVSPRGRLNSEGGLRLAGSQADVPAALADLVYQATRADAGQRVPDVDTFATLLHAATEAMPAAAPDRGSTPSVPPEPSALVPGDIVAGRWRVIRELGSGSTARAFLVQGTSAGAARHVLKVAHDPDADIRVREEAAVLATLDHPSIVRLVDGPITVGERAALVTEQAGERTLSALIRKGPLSPDLLETLGDDLLDAAAYLAARGVYHRDIKPANGGMRRSPERPRAVLFDFSHANSPLDGIEAGTVGYRDPFLSREPLPDLPHRPVWDPAAELYAVAATLFEMAARTCPRYGEGTSDPQAVPDGATIGEDMFAGMPRWQQKELTEFFRRALRRNSGDRFPSIAAMRTAWAAIFHRKDTGPRPAASSRQGQAAAAGRARVPSPKLMPRPAVTAKGPTAHLAYETAGECTDEPAKTLGALTAGEATAISAEEFARRFGRDSQQARRVLSLLRDDNSPDTLKPYREWFREAFADTRSPQRDSAAGAGVPAGEDTPLPNRVPDNEPPTVSAPKNVTSPPRPRHRPAGSFLPAQPVTPASRAALRPDTRPATGGFGRSGLIRGPVFSGDGVPSTVLAAISLMYAGAAASLVTTVVSLNVTSSQWWSDYPVSIILWILLARKSRNGWRPTQAIGSVLFGIATLILSGEATSPQSGIATICDVVVWLVGLGAVICLWQPASTEFFGLRENRRLPPRGPYGRYGPW